MANAQLRYFFVAALVIAGVVVAGKIIGNGYAPGGDAPVASTSHPENQRAASR